MGNFRDALRAKRGQPRKTIHVKVPEYDEPITLQRLQIGEVIPTDEQEKEGLSKHLNLARMIVDGDGRRCFDDSQADEIGQMDTESWKMLMDAANELNGVTEKQNAKTIKNSAANQNVASANA